MMHISIVDLRVRSLGIHGYLLEKVDIKLYQWLG